MKANTATKQPKPSCAKKRWIERIWGTLPFIFLIVLVLIIAIFFQRTQIKKERIAAEKSAGLAQEQTAVNVVTLDIAGILQTTRRGVKVTVQATGKALWLPRSHVDFMPGRVIIPT